MSDEMKRAAAASALEEVESGMTLGLGSGSTAAIFVRLLGERVVREGLAVRGVPTSEMTRAVAEDSGVPLIGLDEAPQLDLTVDGTDEVDPALRLIKGGGGALTREKIVAAASRRMVVIADASKKVDVLGRYPLPIEIMPFGQAATRRHLAAALTRLGLPVRLSVRCGADGADYGTDNGNLIIDAALGAIPDPETLAEALAAIPGVVEHGLFIGMAARVILAGPGGLEVIDA